MEKFKCKRCGYVTNLKSRMCQHLSRKHECDPILSNIPQSQLTEELVKKSKNGMFKCNYCEKEFAHRSTKSTHMSSCTRRDFDIVEKVRMLEKELQSLKTKEPQTIIINNNTTNNIVNTTNNTVQLHSFGLETIKHIMDDKDFMDKMFMNQPKSYIKLLEKVHFDPEHPENKTVRITNKKEPYIQVFDKKKGWRVETQDAVIDDMLNNSKNMIEEHLYDNEDELHNKIRDTEVFEKLLCIVRGLKDYMSGEVEITDKVRKKEAKAMILTFSLMNPEV
jgi:hypothetical protein